MWVSVFASSGVFVLVLNDDMIVCIVALKSFPQRAACNLSDNMSHPPLLLNPGTCKHAVGVCVCVCVCVCVENMLR